MVGEVFEHRSRIARYRARVGGIVRQVDRVGIVEVERRYHLPPWGLVLFPSGSALLVVFLSASTEAAASRITFIGLVLVLISGYLLGVAYAGRHRRIGWTDLSPEVAAWCWFKPKLMPYGRWRPQTVRSPEKRSGRWMRRLLTLLELTVLGTFSWIGLLSILCSVLFPPLILVPGLLLSGRLRSEQVAMIRHAYDDYFSGQTRLAELHARTQLSQRQIEEIEHQRQMASRALAEVRGVIAERRAEIGEIERSLAAMKDEQSRLEGLVRSPDSVVHLAAEMHSHNLQVEQIFRATRDLSDDATKSSGSSKLLWWVGLPVTLALNLLTSWIWDVYRHGR